MIQNCMSEQQRRNAVQILLTLDKKDYVEGSKEDIDLTSDNTENDGK